MKEVTMYIAGPLFTAAERFHNATLEKSLIGGAKKVGIDLKTTLPQRKALGRLDSKKGTFDIQGIVDDCEEDASSSDYILCNLDGTDADSGTAVEFGIVRGIALANQKLASFEGERGLAAQNIKVPKIITYRTDFRTSIENEVGVNAMLRPSGPGFIYLPCFKVESHERGVFYNQLASKIVDVIQKGLK